MTPWLQDADVTLYHGDALAVLRELPAESVDCCVTSPPYWGLRDYGTGAWDGGDPDCEHKRPRSRRDGAGRERPDLPNPPASWAERDSRVTEAHTECECGATRIDQQLGLEPTPEEYVTRMVEVFREVRRVLAAHGTVWLNLGDSYGANVGGHAKDAEPRAQPVPNAWRGKPGVTPVRHPTKPKDLVGIPWRVAFALQADGWYLRSDIIWAKPNPMPESVTDRPTKAHEYVFLLSKQPRYFFDQEAVRERYQADHTWDAFRGGHGEPSAYTEQKGPQDNSARGPDGRKNTNVRAANGSIQHRDGERWPNGGRNIRSVWEIATQPYPEAHFATFPEELARRCIAAGCPEDGTVLDPFMGSGTVAHVARKLGRHAVGIDLSEEYLKLAARRLQQQSLFAEPAA